MRPLLAAALLVGMCVADEKPTAPPMQPSTVSLEKAVRVACLADAKPQKIGVLTYYPNEVGGFTFKDGKRIAFYAIPYLPVTSKREHTVNRQVGKKAVPVVVATVFHATIGPSKMAFGSYAVYRSEVMADGAGGFLRQYIPIAMWSRDTPDGKFRFSIMAEDGETRLKLKSIVPVLEHATRRPQQQ